MIKYNLILAKDYLRYCIVLILFNFYSMAIISSDKYAIVIGIGEYPLESGWCEINGDKDIPLVKDFLLYNGFHENRIFILKNDEAKASAIRKTFVQLLDEVKYGDVVYVHFSGHGQQVMDLNGDEDDNYDESWVAYDAYSEYKVGVYEGNNHILDDELNLWLHNIRQKIGSTGKITVVADACHSGTLSAQIFNISHVLTHSIVQIASSKKDTTSSSCIRGSGSILRIPPTKQMLSSQIKAPIDWNMISACKSYQCNFEYKGKGSLTCALSMHKNILSKQPCISLMDSITSTIKNSFLLSQTPVLECSEETSLSTIF